MKIALTVWGNRISPVFASANTLMIVDVENSKVTSREYERFNPKVSSQTIAVFQDNEIDILICGAICEANATLMEQNGIKLIPFISGSTNKILATLINEKHRISDFIMPGVVLDANSTKNHLLLSGSQNETKEKHSTLL